MGQIIVLNQAGDETIEWDPADPDSCARAENQFKDLKEKGYRFFKSKTVETKGDEVKRFSKDLGKIIAAPIRKPAMAGGPTLLRS